MKRDQTLMMLISKSLIHFSGVYANAQQIEAESTK